MNEQAPQLHAVAGESAAAIVDDPIWDQRPELDLIRTFARARGVAPWSMFGATLARVCATIPPNVTLPALVGGRGSLNLFVGIVGTSGMGKGAGERASRDGVEVGDVLTSSIGSGEGLLHLFAHWDKDEERVVVHQDRVLLSVPEVDALTALGGRQGATLLPTLRSAFTGEQLSPAYANREKALRLDDHSYRLALLMGIQPGRAGALLADSDGGTPQRFLWLPATDPAAPTLRPVEPQPLLIKPQPWPAQQIELSVPSIAQDRIKRERTEVLKGVRESGHLMFVRLKVAALLSVLAGRRAITPDDWTLSGRVIKVSEKTRENVAEYLRDAASTVHRERGRLDGERADARDVTAQDLALRRVCQWVVGRLQKADATKGDLNRSARSTDRELIEPALERLFSTGAVMLSGAHYQLTGRAA